MLIVDQEATALLAATIEADPETKIRALWTAQGVPEEMQNALVAGIAAKAQPGAARRTSWPVHHSRQLSPSQLSSCHEFVVL